MKFISLFIATIVVLFGTILASNPALASQYGDETKPGHIFIDKKVITPLTSDRRVQDGEFVDNLFDFNQRFKPTQNLYFKIRIKNVSNIPLSNIQIKDFYPEGFIDSVGGAGTMTRENNRLVIVIDEGTLQPDEERVEFIQFRVVPIERLNTNINLFCGAQGVINKVQVTASNGAFDEDNTQFCIEKATNVVTAVTTKVVEIPGQVTTKQAIPAERIPSAGPAENVLIIAGELLTLISGIYLKKKVA